MSYQNVSLFAAIIFIALSVVLFALPELVYWLFSLQGNELGSFLAKRAAMLFLGFSIICFLSRNSSNTELQNTISLAIGTSMAGMALLGLYELVSGSAGVGILVAIAVEVVISSMFFWLRKQNAYE